MWIRRLPFPASSNNNATRVFTSERAAPGSQGGPPARIGRGLRFAGRSVDLGDTPDRRIAHAGWIRRNGRLLAQSVHSIDAPVPGRLPLLYLRESAATTENTIPHG